MILGKCCYGKMQNATFFLYCQAVHAATGGKNPQLEITDHFSVNFAQISNTLLWIRDDCFHATNYNPVNHTLNGGQRQLQCLSCLGKKVFQQFYPAEKKRMNSQPLLRLKEKHPCRAAADRFIVMNTVWPKEEEKVYFPRLSSCSLKTIESYFGF